MRTLLRAAVLSEVACEAVNKGKYFDLDHLTFSLHSDTLLSFWNRVCECLHNFCTPSFLDFKPRHLYVVKVNKRSTVTTSFTVETVLTPFVTCIVAVRVTRPSGRTGPGGLGGEYVVVRGREEEHTHTRTQG